MDYNPEQQKMLDLVDALLNMTVANGCTEAEASNAAGRASAMLMKHGMSMQDINLTRQVKTIEATVSHDFCDLAEVHKNSWYWQGTLAATIAKTCGCSVVLSGKDERGQFTRLRFIGRPANIQVCVKLFDWLVLQFTVLAYENRDEAKKIAKEHKIPGRRATIGKMWLENYLDGLVTRVCQRIVEEYEKEVQVQNAQQYAITLYDENKAYQAEHFGKPGKVRAISKQRNHGAYGKGYHDGNGVDIGGPKEQISSGIKQLGGRT